jgi:hypothetical protein
MRIIRSGLIMVCLLVAGGVGAQTKYVAQCGHVSQNPLSGLYYFTPFYDGGIYCLADTTGLGAALAHGPNVYVWGEYSPTAIVLDCGIQMTVTHIDTCTCCRGYRGNVDGDFLDGVDISDLSALIDYLYISFTPLLCTDEADLDASGNIDISDLTRIIDCLYMHPGDCSSEPCRAL